MSTWNTHQIQLLLSESLGLLRETGVKMKMPNSQYGVKGQVFGVGQARGDPTVSSCPMGRQVTLSYYTYVSSSVKWYNNAFFVHTEKIKNEMGITYSKHSMKW